MTKHGRRNEFHKQVESREKRKLKARREPPFGAMDGMGLFGVVGWAVAVPTIVGIFLGVWIDLTWPGPRSWALMLMVLGLATGCASAWCWLTRQRNRIVRERDDES
ncbi:MAG: AtpZ/AtpI family protein [Pseudodesulfovibrio sp.]|nr:AtpZ/AtpI family protein [Pseudodesulfovibrio sp.]